MRALRRAAAGVGSAALGTAFVLGLVLAMNGGDPPASQAVSRAAASFETAPPPKAAPPKRPKREAPKKRARAAPPLPALTASLSGLSFGLDAFEGADLDADALLGDVGDVVMTEDAVDDPPRPMTRTAAAYPARARQKNIEGDVTLSLLVGADGGERDGTVLEAHPAGVFEEAAVAAVRTWRFAPATYQGRPVPVRVQQTLRFALE